MIFLLNRFYKYTFSVNLSWFSMNVNHLLGLDIYIFYLDIISSDFSAQYLCEYLNGRTFQQQNCDLILFNFQSDALTCDQPRFQQSLSEKQETLELFYHRLLCGFYRFVQHILLLYNI